MGTASPITSGTSGTGSAITFTLASPVSFAPHLQIVDLHPSLGLVMITTDRWHTTNNLR
ncbi:MAG TPA: hypothetical protein VGI23_23055 [Steroidobacteraceae bacterium]